MSNYTDWLDEHLGARVRYELELDPAVAQQYQAAGLIGTALIEPELADLPFDEVDDDDLHEAVTGESIAPPGTDPEVAAEIDELAEHLSEEEKAAVAALTPDEVAAALVQAKAEAEAAEPGGTAESGGAVGSEDAVGSEPELADLPSADVDDEDLQEAVTGIVPAGTDPAVAAEINDLADHMTDEEKAAFADLTPDEVAEALAQAQAQLDIDPAGNDAGPVSGAEPVLADVVANSSDIKEVGDAPAAEQTILPPDVDPVIKAMLDPLTPLMTEEEKEILGQSDPMELQSLIMEIRHEMRVADA